MRRLILSILFINLYVECFCQLNDGHYTFTNGEITLSFDVVENGEVLNNVIIQNHKSQKTDKGNGEWFRVNPNGADSSYDGPMGWYQFQTDNCNYEFDEPASSLKLSKFDCKNGEAEMEYILRPSIK